MEKEIWKSIPEYENIYEISSYGRVKSIHYHQTGESGILALGKHKDGYLEARLAKNGKTKIFKVHRLVAEAFIPNPECKKYVDHIDTDKTNNCVSNLRWVTMIENANNPLSLLNLSFARFGHTVTNETRQKISNAKKNKGCIELAQYTKDNKLVRFWGASRIAEEELNIPNTNIIACCKGKRKSAGGFIWKYREHSLDC